MLLRKPLLVALAGVSLVSALFAFQRPFREFPGFEYNDFPRPPDWQEKTEWTFARLMYPPASRGRFRFGGLPDWRQGYSPWTIDYPRGDRHIVAVMRRLTRLHIRSVEQPVNLDEGDHYDWPWLYGVEVGQWELTDDQVKAMREYLLRGGFFMCDDFHGTYEWGVFEASMRRVFPDRPMVEIPSDDPIFHSIYDLDHRFQVPGAQYLRTGRTYERADGVEPHWRGIYDDKGRLMVAICFDMDLGDALEHADEPYYPQRFSALAIRIFANYVAYALTH